jgi:uncharacterized protein YbbK (DUF523 family)
VNLGFASRGGGTTASPHPFHALAVELRDLFWLAPAQRPRVALSSCLAGEAVRWDGGHKRDEPLLGALREWAELVTTCPEMGSGMGAPRPPLVVAWRGAARLVERESGADQTAAFAVFTARRIGELAPLDGAVWKSRSPSCGRRGVAVQGGDGGVVARGPGLFARAVRAAWPQLAHAEEGELASERARAAFRLAAEWSLAWRVVAARAAVALLHRKLRGWWREVARAEGGGGGNGGGEADVRALDRVVAAAGRLDAPATATAYFTVASTLLRRRVGRIARERSPGA